jgi:hypothetical protein
MQEVKLPQLAPCLPAASGANKHLQSLTNEVIARCIRVALVAEDAAKEAAQHG